MSAVATEEQIKARKRVILKRFLTKHKCNFCNDASTPILAGLAKLIYQMWTQRDRVLRHEEIVKTAEEHYYVMQLVAAKILWGPDATLGVLHNGHTKISTIGQMVDIGWVPEKYRYLDQHLGNLIRHVPKAATLPFPC